MTTIACNRDEMYGDLQYTNGSFKFKGNTKVYRFKAHPKLYDCDFIVGFSGVASSVVSISDYFANPDVFPKPRLKSGDTFGLVLTEDREIYRFDHYSTWIQVDAPFNAIGSGMEFAMGAMAAGLSPREAIKVASQNDVYTGMGIKGYRL